MSLGGRKDLEVDDLYDVLPVDKSDSLGSSLQMYCSFNSIYNNCNL